MITDFNRYQHLERIGTPATAGIDVGTCYIFPKIDGTNASIWNDNGYFACGSRNRKLDSENDNHGFFNSISPNYKYINLLRKYPDYVFYGEWLVPHSIKTYRDDAWKQFYIFDVMDFTNPENPVYIHYDVYSEFLKELDIPFVPCISKVTNPTYEQLQKLLQSNTYLIQEGLGIGEGIVIKRYDFVNKYGNIVWAKLVSNQFKEKHVLAMGGTVVNNSIIEEEIANLFVTKHSVDKIVAKIINREQFDPQFLLPKKYIAELLSTVYYDLVTEELWNALKKFKNPTINFKTLNHCVINRTKQLIPEYF